MNTLLPLHYVDFSSLFSPLGDVLWRFPEIWCSLLCISFLSEDKRASSPTWTTLPESFTEKGKERRARISLVLFPSNVSLVDDGMVQVNATWTVVISHHHIFDSADRHQGTFDCVKEQTRPRVFVGDVVGSRTCANIVILFFHNHPQSSIIIVRSISPSRYHQVMAQMMKP